MPRTKSVIDRIIGEYLDMDRDERNELAGALRAVDAVEKRINARTIRAEKESLDSPLAGRPASEESGDA